MAKKLVIVESPAKAKTLGRFLGSDYSIKASMGHIRDLPRSNLGVDIENGFEPKYVVPRPKAAVVKELREAARKAGSLYLATDPDREGEAISWHLMELIKPGDLSVHRVVFHEITPEAVKEAFRHPRSIDASLVNAQQARRILDRLVGYKISPLLWKKVQRGLSAGRVQSVALKMVVDREKEIQAFVPVEYWSIDAELAKATATTARFKAALVGHSDGKKLQIHNKAESDKLLTMLKGSDYAVAKVTQKEQSRSPAPPFITSTLQQDAFRKLGFTAQRTMAIAQQLYEGLPVGKEGSVGLITYMRTDSTNVAASALAETRDYVNEKYGGDYLPPQPRHFARKVKGAQEAHEAIRPTRIHRLPEDVKQYLTREQARLYELIWKRMVASQMATARFNNVTVDIHAKNSKPAATYLLRASSSRVKFPGFLALYSESRDDEEPDKPALPDLKASDKLNLLNLYPEQHFTQPPSRYTEATLIKALEENGIGRPSTYAPILSILGERQYVQKEDGRFKPEKIGFVVSDLLTQYFPDIVDVGFTANLEVKLDEVARGEQEWRPLLKEFYKPFDDRLTTASQQIEKAPDEEIKENCPQCGKSLVIKSGRHGKFIACTGYPECRYTRPMPGSAEAQTEAIEEPCPDCGKPLVIRTGRFGRFIACSGYPTCKYSRPILKKVGVACPECGGDLVERRAKGKRSFYGCSNYPKCKFIANGRPLPQPCSSCGGLMTAYSKKNAKCVKCGHTEALAEQAEPVGAGRS
ncbi:MAG: type I DNA topoisomerase [Chloroflexi bacterium]|nr:type I DNA topoisomerase [Chloroflexota bacterium]